MAETNYELDPANLTFSDGRPQVAVDASTGCWIWQGTKTRGYGRVRIGKRSSIQAHRYTFELAHGQIPDGFEVGHSCLRRTCVNPYHMVLQTPTQNKADRYKMPTLSAGTLAEIERHFREEKPNSWISNEFGISHFAIRRLAREFNWPSLPF